MVLTASTSVLFLKALVQAGVGNDTIKVTGTGVTSASLKAGIGDDLMSITGGITDGSLFGGVGNDSFNFTGGRVLLVIDTGTGADSVLLGALWADSLTLTGALTGTTLKAGTGELILWLLRPTYSAGLIKADRVQILSISLLAPPASLEPLLRVMRRIDKISLYGANDVVFDIASTDSIFGGTGADTMLFTGTVLSNSIQAGSGNDSIVMSGDGNDQQHHRSWCWHRHPQVHSCYFRHGDSY